MMILLSGSFYIDSCHQLNHNSKLLVVFLGSGKSEFHHDVLPSIGVLCGQLPLKTSSIHLGYFLNSSNEFNAPLGIVSTDFEMERLEMNSRLF